MLETRPSPATGVRPLDGLTVRPLDGLMVRPLDGLMVRPLDGLTAGRCRAGMAGLVCDWLLAGLGATLVERHPDVTPAHLRPATVDLPTEGIPAGTLAYTTGVALAAAALAGWRASRAMEVAETGVAMQVWLPEVMAASYRSPMAMRPTAPLPAPGGGWLAADLGAPGDSDTFERLIATLPPGAAAQDVAAAAQQWRLAVCEYRRRPAHTDAVFPIAIGPAATGGPDGERYRPAAGTPASPGGPACDPCDTAAGAVAGAAAPLGGVRICDLTTMWAGPLATWLLQGLGATVLKIEPAFRPDGFRATSGGGIYPFGSQTEPGSDSAMWNALDNAKQIRALDLRDRSQRRSFVALAGSCDLVIDSFSPRVMPNFGVVDEVAAGPARPVLISMPAFPPGPRRDWVAYGTGVHAILGLGDVGGTTVAAPAVSYPDPVAGFTAALAAVAAVIGRCRGLSPSWMEVPLASASQPLLGLPHAAADGAGPTLLAAGEAGPTLLAAGEKEGLLELRRVAGVDLSHPGTPVRPVSLPTQNLF